MSRSVCWWSGLLDALQLPGVRLDQLSLQEPEQPAAAQSDGAMVEYMNNRVMEQWWSTWTTMPGQFQPSATAQGFYGQDKIHIFNNFELEGYKMMLLHTNSE